VTVLIAIEEAFSLPELDERRRAAFARRVTSPVVRAELARRQEIYRRDFAARLADFAGHRLPEMDAAGVDVQVLSLTTPGIQGEPDAATAVADARTANDFLAGVVADHGGRFQGFAALPLQDPRAAVTELRRAVDDLGFVGALVNDHGPDVARLRRPEYDPLWQALADLGVPLYLHPGAPAIDPADVTPDDEWSWAADAAIHALRLGARTAALAARLVHARVFDRHPGARIILGHMGEGLPFQLARLDARYRQGGETRLQRPPSAYFGDNVLITTSGIHSPETLAAAVLAVGADAVLFAVDYPFESSAEAVRFLQSAPLSVHDREKIAHRNAERLLLGGTR
jgi:2,3-dihydroxybenzoate decarboxylase